MNVRSMEEALADSQTFMALVKEANVPVDDARRVLAALAGVPIRQAIRLCTTARRDVLRRINRDVKRGR